MFRPQKTGQVGNQDPAAAAAVEGLRKFKETFVWTFLFRSWSKKLKENKWLLTSTNRDEIAVRPSAKKRKKNVDSFFLFRYLKHLISESKYDFIEVDLWNT